MKRFVVLILCLALVSNCISNHKEMNNSDEFIQKASQQLAYLPAVKDTTEIKSKRSIFPRTLTDSGDLVLVSKRDWTSGFYPGILWYMYRLTGEKQWE
jgi:hypothetical protein